MRTCSLKELMRFHNKLYFEKLDKKNCAFYLLIARGLHFVALGPRNLNPALDSCDVIDAILDLLLVKALSSKNFPSCRLSTSRFLFIQIVYECMHMRFVVMVRKLFAYLTVRRIKELKNVYNLWNVFSGHFTFIF